MPLPEIDSRSALFLDFDGTLVDIAAQPGAVVVEPGLIDTLRHTCERLRGALALISGRPIADLDRLLHPLVLPAAGIHGAERRLANGRLVRKTPPDLDLVLAAADRLVAAESRLLVERKGFAVALHYRAAPQCEAACVDAMSDAAEHSGGLHVLRGKMVVEVLPADIGKGYAALAFMQEEPFAGRSALFVGDDTTDEAAFVALQAHGGLGVKVGAGASAAAHRIESASAVRRWLSAIATAEV